MKKRRIRHTREFEFCIEGPAKFDGCGEYISEKVRAYSEWQAFWQLARRLEKQRNQVVYLGDCRIYVTKVFPSDYEKMDKQLDISFKKEQHQLTLHFF